MKVYKMIDLLGFPTKPDCDYNNNVEVCRELGLDPVFD